MASVIARKCAGRKRLELPPLLSTNESTIDFLAQRGDYSLQSAKRAVAAAIPHFQKKQYEKAAELLGIGYEVLRKANAEEVYLPFLQAMVLQRSVCLSAAGQHVLALQEIEVSLRFLPYCPSSLFWRGFLLLKDGARVDDAYECFKLLLRINDEWLDLVEITLAIFLHVHGFLDKAIGMCAKVLNRLETAEQQELAVREPRLKKRMMKLFAHLVRGDSYKFHGGGYFARPAADDYSVLFELAPRLFGTRLGRGFSLDALTDVDKLFLQLDILPCGTHFATDMIKPAAPPESPRKGPEDAWILTSEFFRLKHTKNLRPWRVFIRVGLASRKFLGKSETGREMLQKRKRGGELAVSKRDALEQDRRNMAARILTGLDKFSTDEQLAVWGPTEQRMCRVTPYRRGWLEPHASDVTQKSDVGMLVRSEESGPYRKFEAELCVPSPRGRFQGTEPKDRSSSPNKNSRSQHSRAASGSSARGGATARRSSLSPHKMTRSSGMMCAGATTTSQTATSLAATSRSPRSSLGGGLGRSTPGGGRARSSSVAAPRAESSLLGGAGDGAARGRSGNDRPVVAKTGEKPEMHIGNCPQKEFVTSGLDQPTPVKTTAELVRAGSLYAGSLEVGWSRNLLDAADAGTEEFKSAAVTTAVLQMLGVPNEVDTAYHDGLKSVDGLDPARFIAQRPDLTARYAALEGSSDLVDEHGLNLPRDKSQLVGALLTHPSVSPKLAQSESLLLKSAELGVDEDVVAASTSEAAAAIVLRNNAPGMPRDGIIVPPAHETNTPGSTLGLQEALRGDKDLCGLVGRAGGGLQKMVTEDAERTSRADFAEAGAALAKMAAASETKAILGRVAGAAIERVLAASSPGGPPAASTSCGAAPGPRNEKPAPLEGAACPTEKVGGLSGGGGSSASNALATSTREALSTGDKNRVDTRTTSGAPVEPASADPLLALCQQNYLSAQPKVTTPFGLDFADNDLDMWRSYEQHPVPLSKTPQALGVAAALQRNAACTPVPKPRQMSDEAWQKLALDAAARYLQAEEVEANKTLVPSSSAGGAAVEDTQTSIKPSSSSSRAGCAAANTRVRPQDANDHLRGRAMFLGQDVVDCVKHLQGAGDALLSNDTFPELDKIQDVTDMVRFPPQATTEAFATNWVPQVSQRVGPGELYRVQHNNDAARTWKPDAAFTMV